MRRRDTDNRWTLLSAAATAFGTAVVAVLAGKSTAALSERVAVLEEKMRRLEEKAKP